MLDDQVLVPYRWEELLQYYRLSIYRGHLKHDNTHRMIVTMVKPPPDFALKNDTPDFSREDEIWGVVRENFEEKWPR